MATEMIYDLAVVGAGIYGIQAARTYLDIHPDDKVIIFEADREVGGVWSTERVYDAFWTQTPLGMLEFSDFPLQGVPEDQCYHGFFPAKHVAGYLQTYVATRIYGGRSLASRIYFNTRVEKLVKSEEGWEVLVRNSESDSDTVGLMEYKARKIIDATGLTSTPNTPTIPNRDSFKGQTFHHKDFARHQVSILDTPEPLNIAVIGGAKSAADIAYACAKVKAGHRVHWIIRRSGAGPAAFVSPKASWPYKNSNESFYTRITSHFLVSWFFDESGSWLGRFLYHTNLGQRLIRSVWRAINKKAHRLANYDRPDGQKNGFHNLKPDTEIFWQNDSTGINQRPDFFDTIASRVKVHREDIKSMTEVGLELVDGTSVNVDCVIFATGWTTSHPKIVGIDRETDIRPELGLSVACIDSTLDVKRNIYWRDLEQTAQQEVLSRLPLLHNRPPHHQSMKPDKYPIRLYKGVIPIHDRSIAFVGQLLSGNNFRISEVQALYAVAALNGTHALPSVEQMEKRVARTIAWDRLRYLDKGLHGGWIYWDMVPYTDELLAELGLVSHRQGGWWRDLFKPCVAEELKGLIEEYRAKVNQMSIEKCKADVDGPEG